MAIKDWTKWLDSLTKDQRKSAELLYDVLLITGRKAGAARRLAFLIMNEVI